MIWRLGVAGFPIEHSLSPLLHEAGLSLAGLSGSSVRLSIKAEEANQLTGIMGRDVDALSVTMPLKERVGSLCASLDPVAARTGSVNSLLWREGELHGACTDGKGFTEYLGTGLSYELADKVVAVLGAGGAAKAIVDGLVEVGVKSVLIFGRTASHVSELVERYAVVKDGSSCSESIDLVINTTPVEGRSDRDQVLDGVKSTSMAVDITYEPRMSTWRSRHEAMGCRTANGLGMLAYQAALQMQWWFEAPISGAQLLEVIQ